jgi:hypothetical protein
VTGLVISRIISKDKQLLKWYEIFILFGIMAAVVLFLFLFDYLYESPVGSKLIQNIQGRYFLVVIPYLLFGFSQIYIFFRRHREIKLALFGFFLVALLFISVRNISKRYFDYSKLISNGETLSDFIRINKVDLTKPEFKIINKPIQMIIEAQPGDKISGFMMYVISGGQILKIPYRYELRDANCGTILQSGYLDITKLQNQGKYTEYIPITQAKTSLLCLNLIPLNILHQSPYLALLTYNQNPIIKFLYIKK